MNFQGREATPIRSRRLPQQIETPVTFDAIPHAYVRYAYARSSDSMNSGIDGQDYLCYQHNDQRLVFVVADGVSQSFCGNLAARILGDGVLEWLWSLDVAYLNGAAALQESAVSHLNKMQKAAQVEVEEYEIPDEVQGLVRQALEGQRAYGSEAIFAACRIDHPSPMIPEGLISVFWMGDTRIRVNKQGDAEVDLGGANDLGNRWSTVRGVRGTLTAFMQPLTDVQRVTAYTDGLSAHEGQLLSYSDAKLNREIAEGSKLASSDDVAFIDVVLRTPQYEGYPPEEVPDPNMKRPSLEQIWNPQHKDTFELRWSWQNEEKNLLGQEQKAAFLIQEAHSPTMADGQTIEVSAGATSWKPGEPRDPGSYYYRVRALPKRGSMTPWSELRQTKVAFPPPPAPHFVTTEGTTLEWSDEGETLDYVLERATDENFAEVEKVYEGRGTAYTINMGATKPGVYWFRVKAISDGGPGPYSEGVEISLTPPAPPRPQLASLSFDAFSNSYKLRWQATVGAAYYDVEEREDERGETRILTTENTQLTIDVDDREVGAYVYRVRACHDWACSEWSNEQTFTITPPAPEKAPDLTLDGPDDKAIYTLTWSEVEYATSYTLEASESKDFHDARMYIREERELTITRREPGVLYFRAAGSNAGGDGPWSVVESIIVAPDKPSWIEVNHKDDGIHVEWGAVGGNVSYTLEQVTGSGDEQATNEVYSGDDPHAVVAATQAGMLTYRVRAEAPGVSSGWQLSDPIEIKGGVAGPPLMPAQLDKRGGVRLEWQPIDEAEGYVLEVARDELFGIMVRGVRVEATQVTFHPPAAGQYWFRVKALAEGVPGKPGEAVSIKVDKPAAPRLWPLDPVEADTMFEVAWAGIAGCDYYEADFSTQRGFPDSKTKRLKAYHPSQKIAIPGYTKGRYFVRVRAVDENGTFSVWSDTLEIEVT